MNTIDWYPVLGVVPFGTGTGTEIKIGTGTITQNGTDTA